MDVPVTLLTTSRILSYLNQDLNFIEVKGIKSKEKGTTRIFLIFE